MVRNGNTQTFLSVCSAVNHQSLTLRYDWFLELPFITINRFFGNFFCCFEGFWCLVCFWCKFDFVYLNIRFTSDFGRRFDSSPGYHSRPQKRPTFPIFPIFRRHDVSNVRGAVTRRRSGVHVMEAGRSRRRPPTCSGRCCGSTRKPHISRDFPTLSFDF